MKNIISILHFVMILVFWNCSGGSDEIPIPAPKPEEKPKIEVSSNSSVINQEGGTETVSFTSTANWTIDVSAGRSVSWCNVSPTSGSKGANTLTITTSENDTYDERNAKVTIKAGDTTQSFTVSQKQKDALILSSNKAEVKSDGDVITIEVKANVKFDYEIEKSTKEWIETNSSRGLTSSTIKFNVAKNENTNKREGKIIFSSGTLSETVIVYQEGAEQTIILSQNEYVVSSKGEDIKVELKSNGNYEIQMPKLEWLYENTSRALSSSTHYFTILPNNEYESRSAEILFVNKESNISEKVTVKQMQLDAILVAQKEYTIEADGGNLEFEVNSNVDFKVETSVDWVKQNIDSRGLKTTKLKFNISENQNETSREGFITISSGELKQDIKVIQKTSSIFKVSQTEFNIPTAGGDFSVDVTSNNEYILTLPEINWLQEVKTRSTSTTTHTFHVSENETNIRREAEIIIVQKGTNDTIRIKVTQSHKEPINVGKDKYEIDATGGILEFEVISNVDYNVFSSDKWIKQNTESRGYTSKLLSFTIKENTNDTPREGKIYISSNEYSRTITIVQKGISEPEASLGDYEYGGYFEGEKNK